MRKTKPPLKRRHQTVEADDKFKDNKLVKVMLQAMEQRQKEVEEAEGGDYNPAAEKNFIVDRNIPRLLINLVFNHDRSTQRMLRRYCLGILDVCPQFTNRDWELSEAECEKRLARISDKQFWADLKNYNGLNKRAREDMERILRTKGYMKGAKCRRPGLQLPSSHSDIKLELSSLIEKSSDTLIDSSRKPRYDSRSKFGSEVANQMTKIKIAGKTTHHANETQGNPEGWGRSTGLIHLLASNNLPPQQSSFNS